MTQVGGFHSHLAACPQCGKDLSTETLVYSGEILDETNTPVRFAACKEHLAEAHERVLETLGLPRAGRDRRRATPEQLPVSEREHLESMAHFFGGADQVFAILGQLQHAVDGRIVLRDFLAAASLICRRENTRSAVAALITRIEHAGWERVAGSGPGTAFRAHEFALSVRVATLSPGARAVHVFVEYGSTGPAVAEYLGRMFPHHLRRLLAVEPPRIPSAMDRRRSQAARRLRTADLARRLRNGSGTVLTGAGVSTASGIFTCTGPGSLEAWKQLAEPFAGPALDWMLRQPARLASLVGSVQASLIRARPNRAHHALVELERRGLVKQLLTTNFDDLHQSAGSVRCKQIGKADNGRTDLHGNVLLATGVSSDQHGLLRAARAAGMDVVVLDPVIPEFVQETDLYLPGRAEVVLPELAEMLGP